MARTQAAKFANADEVIDDLKRRIGEIDSRIPRLLVKRPTAIKGLQVSVDDDAVEASNAALALDPGKHIVRASAPGYRPFLKSVSLKPGEKQTLTITLVPDSQATSDGSSANASGAGVPALSVVGFVTAGVGAATFAIAGAVAFARSAELDKVCDAAGACDPGPGSQGMVDRQDEIDRANLAAHFATAGIVVAGAGLALGIIPLLFGDEEEDDDEEQAMIVPAVGLTGASLTIRF